ncbi:metallophosphoesterase [Enterobacter ludwigii]|jgi:predicted MPP superfamily phosphohydrolase|nr:metallophosphoesterase [Enterobacter ludwigii]
MKNIIHLSDLHLSHTNKNGFFWEDAKKVLSKLILDIETIQNDHGIKVDTIFFTGDMVQAGTKEQYELFKTNILTPLTKALNLTYGSFFFVPGNHDVDRNKVHFLEKTLREGNNKQNIEQYYDLVNSGEETWRRLTAFNEFNEEMLVDSKTIHTRGVLSCVHKISNSLYVICLNSAWLAMDDYDQGNLRITEKQLDFFKRARIPHDAQIIGLIHHPADWLENQDRDYFSSYLEKKVDMLLFGHMHTFKQKSESNFSDDITLFLQAGTLDTRESFTGYSVILLNKTNDITDGRLLYRKFDKEQDSFVPWTDRADNGQIDFSTKSGLKFDSDKFAKFSGEISNRFDFDLLINIGTPEERKKRLVDLFTEPNFVEINTVALQSKPIKSTNDIIDSHDNYVIFGSSSSGRTSILKYMFINSLKKQQKKDFSEFSFYLDASTLNFSSSSAIFGHLCKQYFSSDLTTNFEEKVKKMIVDGDSVIYIDNIDKLENKQLIILSKFLADYKTCRFVITADFINLPQIASLLSESDKNKFIATSIGSLRRCNVREIVSKWHDESSQNAIYKEITRTINNSQLPHNYFIYSMLLAIYEVDHDIKGILTESDIIQNFIEILLRKHFMDTPANKPQYKELLHFLGFIGKSLFDCRQNFIEKNSLYDLALTFIRETMHDYDLNDYIAPLIASGILRSVDEKTYEFSQPCFLYYSIAYFMGHDRELQQQVISEENYLELDKVVEYYSSQNASNLDLLYYLSERTQGLRKSISTTMQSKKGIDIEAIKIEETNTLSVLDMISTTSDFERKIEDLKSDRESDDARLDQISPLDDSGKKAKIPKKSSEQNNETIKLVETLSLYARVFRSTELSMDRESILSIFKDLVDGYIFYLKSSLILMDESFILPIILPALEKKMQEEGLSQKDKDDIFEIFKLIISLTKSMMPNNIQKMMSDELATKKPRIENIIKEAKNNAQNPVERAMLSYVLMDIKEDNIVKLANELMKDKNKVVKESLFFKINQTLTSNYDLKREDIQALKGFAVAISNERKMVKSNNLAEAFMTLEKIGQ